VSSQIIETNPTSGSATTSSVRDNFGFAKTEINNFERMTEDKVITTNGGSVNTQDANFANDVTLVEGRRISVEIGTGLTTTNTTPTLNVDGTGDKTIVRQDGSALAVGDLKEGQYCDFIYAASGGSHIQDKWVWLNSKTDANDASPTFTGTPAAPTASKNTNTTQLATTAFVMAQTASATESGISELATATEVKAGTDASRILTPENLLRVAVSNAAVSSAGDQGSIEIAGVVIKWGLENSTLDEDQTFTFDTAFPNGCSCVVTQRIKSGATSILGLVSVSAANFVLNRTDGIDGTDPFYFIAIGR